jgi:hypothetical protein
MDGLAVSFVGFDRFSSTCPLESKLDLTSLPGRGVEVSTEPSTEVGRPLELPAVCDFATARARRSCKRSLVRAFDELRETAGDYQPGLFEHRNEISYNQQLV